MEQTHQEVKTAGKLVLVSVVTDPGARGPSGADKQQDLAGRADWACLGLFSLLLMFLGFKVQLVLAPGDLGSESYAYVHKNHSLSVFSKMLPLPVVRHRVPASGLLGRGSHPRLREEWTEQERNVRGSGGETREGTVSYLS